MKKSEVIFLSERWAQFSEKILDQVKKLEETKKRDRLELVRSLRFMLSALNRSLLGWMQWVSNPDIMTRFTQEDLENMSKKLTEFTRSFIEYDLEITSLGTERGLKAQKKMIKKRKDERPEGFYV